MKQKFLLILLVTISTSRLCFAFPASCISFTNPSYDSANNIAAKAQRSKIPFVTQFDQRAHPDSTWGGCGPTCGVIMTQILRFSLGLKSIDNPYELFDTIFEKYPEARKGLVGPNEIHGFSKLLIQKTIPAKLRSRVSVKTSMIDSIFEDRWDHAQRDRNFRLVSDLRSHVMSLGPNEIKIITFVSLNNKVISSGHVAILTSTSNSRLSVLDPYYPTEHFKVPHREIEIDGDKPARSVEIYFPFPNEFSKAFEIDHRHFAAAVTTITLGPPRFKFWL